MSENWIAIGNKKYSFSEFAVAANLKDPIMQTAAKLIADWQDGKQTFVQLSSGSTAAPKQIEIDRSQIQASAEATIKTLGLKIGDTALLSISPEFIGGKMMILRAMIGQMNLVMGTVTANPLQELKSKEKIDFYSFVPYQINQIIEDGSYESLNKATAIILGGAPVSPALSQKISTHIAAPTYSTYGMTETVSHVALKRIDVNVKNEFHALENIAFSVDEKSCLVIEAPQITGIPKLVTNDMVELISTTSFHWLGRYDFVINSAGIKVNPELLENQIEQVFKIAGIENRFFIFGMPHEQLGESVNLLIEGTIDQMQIREILQSKLPKYHLPKQLYRVEKFKETGSGKVDRKGTIEILF